MAPGAVFRCFLAWHGPCKVARQGLEMARIEMRGRLLKYVLVSYVVKTLALGILWLLVPDWPEWAGAKARSLWLSVRPGEEVSTAANPVR
jgi:hypothetical protein